MDTSLRQNILFWEMFSILTFSIIKEVLNIIYKIKREYLLSFKSKHDYPEIIFFVIVLKYTLTILWNGIIRRLAFFLPFKSQDFDQRRSINNLASSLTVFNFNHFNYGSLHKLL